MKYGLSQKTLDAVSAIFFKYPELEKVIIYGSRAKGTQKEGSDVDLTFKGKNLNLAILNKISNELDDLLLPYTFDLSIYSIIDNQDLIDHIDRVGKVFFPAR